MGESAGAFSACFHLAMSSNAHLFQRAILQSAMCDMEFDTLEVAFEQGQTLVAAVGCEAHQRPAHQSVLDCLREMPADDVGLALPNRRGLLLHTVESKYRQKK